MDTLVSIIVPIYNIEEYLEKCLISIQNQTYENIEVLMVNDGSQDASSQIMQKFSSADKRFKILEKENGGLSDARNFGILHAAGQYFSFIDGDDYIESTMIEVMLRKAMEENAEIVVCDMLYSYPDNRTVFATGGEFVKTCFQENHDLVLINNSTCNKLYHRNLFDNTLFIKDLWYEDLAIIPILLAKAKCVCKVEEAFYIYVQRSGSIVHSANKKIFDIYKGIEFVRKYLEQYHLDIAIINKLYIIHALDLTTLRIRDFDDKKIRVEYLRENILLLNQHYPSWSKDELVKRSSFKKKIIYTLLKMRMYHLVLFVYGRKGN